MPIRDRQRARPSAVPSATTTAAASFEPLEPRRLLAGEFSSLITFGDQNDFSRGNAVAVDDGGNVYVAGTFRDEADIAPGADQRRMIRTRPEDREDGFLVKYAPDRSLLWAVTIGGVENDGINFLELGPDGDVYVAGTFRGLVDFQPGDGVTELTGHGDKDAFVARYTGDGQLVWAGNVGGRRDDFVTALAVGPDGDVYYSASIRIEGDVDPTDRVRQITSVGVDDTILSRLRADDGRPRWVKVFGEADTRETVTALAVNATGIFATGLLKGEVRFDRRDPRFDRANVKSDDVFMARLDHDGQWRWLRTIGSDERDLPVGLEFGPAGDLYVAGNFGAAADFDIRGGSAVLRPRGEDDLFVARYQPDGSLVWARQIGEAQDDGRIEARALAVDDAGAVYLTGLFREEVDFDPGPAFFIRDAEKDEAPSLRTFNLFGAGDGFVVKLSRSGRFKFMSRAAGEDGTVVPNAIAVGAGRVISTGTFAGSIDFAPGSGVRRRRTDDDGEESDVFILELLA